MLRKVAVLLACLMFGWIIGIVTPDTAEARRACIGDAPGDWDDCHPEGGGEPASWCGQEHIQGPQSGCWCGQQVAPTPGWGDGESNSRFMSFWRRIFDASGGDPDYVATD